LFLAPVDYPSVSEDTLRYRVAITAAHETVDLDRALQILDDTLVKALRESGTLEQNQAAAEAARARRTARLNGQSIDGQAEIGDWQTMAKFLMRQASAIASSPNKRARIVQLSSMAYEHFVERARDPASAYDRLARAYQELDWRDGLASIKSMREDLRRPR
jgi:glycine C-acetyltransferase